MPHNEMDKILAGVESAVTEMVSSLVPSPQEPGEDTERELITFDREEVNNRKWKAMLKEHLETAKTFEIHCWNEETEWIEVALRFGTFKESDWQHGKIIAGTVTPQFISMLLDMPKPTDTEIYNKMTPFFNLFLDDGFSSSHYGTEVYI